MGEFGRGAGGQLPHEEASTREHFKQVEESIRHEHEADQIAKDQPKKRPWWKFWITRSN
jgi:hypothetical protein